MGTGKGRDIERGMKRAKLWARKKARNPYGWATG